MRVAILISFTKNKEGEKSETVSKLLLFVVVETRNLKADRTEKESEKQNSLVSTNSCSYDDVKGALSGIHVFDKRCKGIEIDMQTDTKLKPRKVRISLTRSWLAFPWLPFPRL